MQGMIATAVGNLAASRRTWRRTRNLRAAARDAATRPARARTAAGPAGLARAWWRILGVLLLIAGGAAVIALHARALGSAVQPGTGLRSLAAFTPALPGLAFTVPSEAGVRLSAHPGGALLVVSSMQAARPVVIDLCQQMLDRDSGRLAPLHVGARFGDVARWAGRNGSTASPLTLRNVVLSSSAMPQLDITGSARGAAPLQLRWRGSMAAAWVGEGSGAIVRGESGSAALGREGWLVWGGEGALRVLRRGSGACPAAGELVLTRYHRATQLGAAMVAAFPDHGPVRSALLAPGDYRVPAAAPTALEDGALFDSLLARGLLRLGADGLVEVAPRDLALWRAAPAGLRAADLHRWDGAGLDAAGLRLLERLYGRADGAFVLEQVRIFNAERRLLAWRLRPASPFADGWQASAGGVALDAGAAMPPASSRLFDRLPEGWAPWRRVADRPAGAGPSAPVRLVLHLARPARGGERVELMLAGRLRAVSGAVLAGADALCHGRACRDPGEVRALTLQLAPGARELVLDAMPLDLAAMGSGGDAAYRHLKLEDGRLAWQALAPATARVAQPAAEVAMRDRHGALLWQDGTATAAARDAGLATLLGLHPGHTSGIAGMLGRLPATGAGGHAAGLTLDLALQRAANEALDCVGMRRGSWDGTRCHGGGAVPDGRQAGLVLLDTGNGDVLAAASAGAAEPPASAWQEVRDFDRADPARSPLRQAALQHDGGAERSPGSTFKIVTALGLELAAQRDGRLDALLDGMPLSDINRLAADRGFAFRTDAATYPNAGQGAHITNFRDQHLDRRARDGRLGLAQALSYSLNTWFAWTAELSDASLFGRAAGGAPSLRALDPEALAGVRPVADMARRLGFERSLRLDGGLLPPDYGWRPWDALEASVAAADPIGSRHELRQMAIGLRMQATPLHVALVAGAVGEGRAIVPRLLKELDGRQAVVAAGAPLGVRLDRIRAGLHGVVTEGTAAGAFRDPAFAGLRAGLYGKTGTAPVGQDGLATVWFTGWLEPGSLPGQTRRLAFAAFVSRSGETGGAHAAPVVAALLRTMAARGEAVRHD